MVSPRKASRERRRDGGMRMHCIVFDALTGARWAVIIVTTFVTTGSHHGDDRCPGAETTRQPGSAPGAGAGRRNRGHASRPGGGAARAGGEATFTAVAVSRLVDPGPRREGDRSPLAQGLVRRTGAPGRAVEALMSVDASVVVSHLVPDDT